VADIFDALTSRRPYKQAWTIDDAFAMLDQLSGVKLDPDCVTALIESHEEIEIIQRQFSEDIVG
jgi:HD-GYP domain-containing protein (c-di-GMP phosphodiesterase class II)